MQTNVVNSYGIIPIRKTDVRLEMLVINMYGSAGGTHWTFPKGRPEIGETALQSALRECKEEVGITPAVVWDDSPIVESYTFVHDDIKVEKTVTFYIGIVEASEITIQPEEIKEALWLPIDKVQEKLTHDSSKSIFIQAKILITERV